MPDWMKRIELVDKILDTLKKHHRWILAVLVALLASSNGYHWNERVGAESKLDASSHALKITSEQLSKYAYPIEDSKGTQHTAIPENVIKQINARLSKLERWHKDE